jgi:hypothetical protein
VTHKDVSLDSYNSHIANMLRIRGELAQLHEMEDSLTKDLESLRNQINSLERDYRKEKQVLNHSLDTDQDPLQVKLSGQNVEPEQEKDSFFNDRYLLDMFRHGMFNKDIQTSTVVKK